MSNLLVVELGSMWCSDVDLKMSANSLNILGSVYCVFMHSHNTGCICLPAGLHRNSPFGYLSIRERYLL